MMMVLVGSMAYSKSARIKDRILAVLERRISVSQKLNQAVFDEIDDELSQIGYRINQNGRQNCPRTYANNKECQLTNQYATYRYCVYECCGEKGVFYKVAAFMYFEIPIINGLIELPIMGETKSIFNNWGITNTCHK